MSKGDKITFNVTDDCFTRAEKMFKLMNVHTDVGVINTLARGLQIYIDLDKEAIEEVKGE